MWHMHLGKSSLPAKSCIIKTEFMGKIGFEIYGAL